MTFQTAFARYQVLELGHHPVTALAGSHLGALGLQVTAVRPQSAAGAVSASELGYDWCKTTRPGLPDPVRWADYDVIIESGELDFEAGWLRPGVVWCRVQGDRHTSAAAVSENIAQARTGLAGYVGSAADPPLRVGAPVVTFTAGVAVVQGVLVGLLRRERLGVGTRLSVGLVRAAVVLLGNNVTSESDPDARTGFARGPWMEPERGFVCRDGAVDLVFHRDDGGFARFCDWLGLPEVAGDPRFRSYPDRTGHPAELTAALAPALRQHTVDEVLRTAGRLGALRAARQRIGDLPSLPQLQHLELLAVLKDVGATGPGLPFRLDGVRPTTTRVKMEAHP